MPGTQFFVVVMTMMMMMGFISVVQGHVKLYYTPFMKSIRNAGTLTSDGAFSTSGPCGGAAVWLRAKANVHIPGDPICARISYNGGHASATNTFRALIACNDGATIKTTETALKVVANNPPQTLITGSSNFVGQTAYPAPETGIVPYTLCVNTPNMSNVVNFSTLALEDVRRQCTLSVLDQRDWGGCIDLLMSNPDGSLPDGATRAPTAAIVRPAFGEDVRIAEEDEGTYVSKLNCPPNFSEKTYCCPTAYIGLKKNTRFASVKLLSENSNCLSITAASKGGVKSGSTFQLVLQQDETDTDALVARFRVNLGGNQAIQEMEVYIRDAKENGVSVINVVEETAPYLADFTATYSMNLQSGIEQGLVPDPTGPVDQTVAIFISVGVIAGLYIIGGFIYGKKTKGYFHHPHLSALIGCCVGMCNSSKKSGKGTGQVSLAKSQPQGSTAKPLPKGWKEAKDNEGDIYYYNKELNKTQWERPV